MLIVEFTIEPFVEGQPGRHVRAAVEAPEALGVSVHFGPLGTTCTLATDMEGAVTAAVVGAAMANGATHVSLHVARMDGDGS
ncbi:MAG: hypothetical protein ACO3S5_10270 [Ilumatobacteraceae bacterium]